ncbi:MAG: hypothetical protein ACOY3D_07650, partial [Candidatus Omnitrophota bacterium]
PKQIIGGVKRAQAGTKLNGKNSDEAVVINTPVMYSADSAPKGRYFATTDRNLVHFVDFDVAVTTDSTSESKGSLSLRVAGVGLDGGGGIIDKNNVVSRVKFQVPITLPQE